MNRYLIPANSKKSQLILGFFTPMDLAIFITGCVVTILGLVLFGDVGFIGLIVILLPLLISAFLIMPVPHYHNILQLLINLIMYFTNRRHYYWKGWCVTDEQ